MLYWDKRERFFALAKRVGIKAPIIDFTPYRSRGGQQRGDEIAYWLKQNRSDQHQQRIVVFDDSNDMDRVKPWFLQINEETGLVETDMKKALKILHGAPWRP